MKTLWIDIKTAWSELLDDIVAFLAELFAQSH